ncbi:TIGR01457 family HAD-type hydrolase [Halobacillus sp. A5]|uniref:TIGR01457 family HAD-type hydrolase n=1 Tax=Halobacillus sp. A5 TaxID=2880263 RepID=UPI0020A670FE|nr:TIGR01457 family HAD-type hydrolase [Halobacillus sp. A5]MCP3028266.1 TIGR01457 family HAD-type hydrolase [Halobacillus sp. A5]
MKNYKAYLIDLDGTMYRGNERIAGAAEFIDELNRFSIPHLFITNNSSSNPEEVASKLTDMQIKAEKEQIFTSSMATARYIHTKNPDSKAYVIGEQGLFDALAKENIEIVTHSADYVVMGIDRFITYEKLAEACLQIRNGASFISTNKDKAIPTERGLVPGNGALTSVVAVSTGVEPVYIGKPEPIIMEQAIQKLGVPKEEILMVGDNYQTDILAGLRANVDTLMVETGVSSYVSIKENHQQPTYLVGSLEEWKIHKVL